MVAKPTSKERITCYVVAPECTGSSVLAIFPIVLLKKPNSYQFEEGNAHAVDYRERFATPPGGATPLEAIEIYVRVAQAEANMHRRRMEQCRERVAKAQWLMLKFNQIPLDFTGLSDA